MNSRFSASVLGALMCIVIGCDSGSYTPNTESAHRIENILTTLSSDDLRGRGSLSVDATKAAVYLATQFEAAGLELLPGENDFLQEFQIHTLATSSAEVEINGAPVADDHFAVRGSAEGVRWSNPSEVNLLFTGPNDDVAGAFDFGYLSGEDFLMLMHESHQDFFDEVKSFLEQPLIGLNERNSANIVVVLTHDSTVNDLSVDIISRNIRKTLYNVVGRIQGERTDEEVIFGGHYDHIGILSPVEGDSIANGANDDASGVTAVIELAYRYASDPKPQRTLVFAAFAAEEIGQYGSQYFSQQFDPDEVMAMFNLEMVGKMSSEGPRSAFITGWEESNFGPLLQEAVADEDFLFFPDPYPDQNLFLRSDNATLASLGVPAHTISSTRIDIDPDYHQVTDEIETLDLDNLKTVIDAVYVGAKEFISGRASPTRVDPK